ncbi:hypothetical protein LOSG293_020560 [Secundilactobacillus oryzae JCM 18671]|uniref:Integral membrane protein n=1 Tax=Secundilactobacillus oryzae JCM 18671 TaxID=1291743 RepID=A0A081BGF0_9LACO|nr:hypothetical protein LOSG293_020560 [Secundilactobacillus oryzae JCM 18671]
MAAASFLLFALTWALGGGLFLYAHDVIAYVLLAVSLVIVVAPTLFGNHPNWQWTGLATSILLAVISIGIGLYSPEASKYSTQQVQSGSASQWAKNYYDQVDQYLKQSSTNFYRTTTAKGYYNYKTVNNNMPMLLGVHNIGAYYSVQDGKVLEFSESVANQQAAMNDPIRSADHRTTLENLLGVKYMFMRIDQTKQQSVPYGFKYIKKQNGHVRGFRDKKARGLGNNTGTVLLKNNNALPLAYVQTHQVSEQSYDNMTPWAREQSMTFGAVTETPASGVRKAAVKDNSRTVDYSVENLSHPLMTADQVVSYRSRNNFDGTISKTNTSEPASSYQTFTPKVEKDQRYGTGVYPISKTLQSALDKNRSIYEDNATDNETGLKSITSDASGNTMVYKLNFNQPMQAKNTELYLDLDGITTTVPTKQDVLSQDWYKSVFRDETRSKFNILQDVRKATLYPNEAGYTLTAETHDNSNNSVQLGITNMSDYEKKTHTLINLGYSAKNRNSVILRFSGVTSIHFKSAKIVAVPFGQSYTNRLQRLKKTKLNNLKIQNDKVTGQTHTTRAGVLTTSIPYNDGWRLKVDGKEQATQVVNKGFVGASVSAGKHNIELTYQTPGLTLGKVATVIGIIGLILSSLIFSGFVKNQKQPRRH